MQKLRSSISGKKFLLVLDDVWTQDSKEWEPLKVNLSDGAPGSKIMVTTRKERVAKMMMSGNVDVVDHVCRPEKLSEEDCWKILRSISLSGRSEEECRMFEEVGRKIATKCDGLPLAANVLGSLLLFKNSLEEWENVFKSEIWQLEEEGLDLFPHLFLSYNELSPTLKRCFTYCAIYPKDSLIKVESLINEWMALGYLGSAIENGGMEVKGRGYFNNLAMRSLFQDFVKRDGSIVRCKMHDIVHDFARFLRGNNDRSHDGGADVTKKSCQVCSPLLVSQVREYRSLSWVVDSPVNICDCLASVRVLRFNQYGRYSLTYTQGMEKLIHLRLLEVSDTELCKDQLKTICMLYFLQTLLLVDCSLKEIPIEIGNLVELRHLDLRVNTEIKELPESMCSLVELRTLQLDDCENLQRLPEGIDKLRNLQQILFWGTPASRCLPRAIGELSGLHTLDNNFFYGGSGCNKLGLLKKLNSLRGTLNLEIAYPSDSDVEELVEDAREAELKNKICINSYSIRFSQKYVARSPLLWMDVMEALEPNLEKLNELRIRRYGGYRLPQWISSPLNLVKGIFLFELDLLSSLPSLGKLPFLEVLSMSCMNRLKFVKREFLGIESSPSTTEVVVAYPKLKQLSFHKFPEWLEWEDITAEEEESNLVSIMPCLEELYITACDGLKKLPHRFLRKASSLRILNIWDSPLLLSKYGDKDGSEWRYISQNNPKLELSSV